ncbi:hypothetical protein D3C77_386600 [compost metagenome]
MDQIVTGAQPDGADVGVPLAVTDKEQGSDKIGREAEKAEARDDRSIRKLTGDGAPDRVAHDGNRHDDETQAFEHGRA